MLLKQLLQVAFGKGFSVREEKGIPLGLETNPVPDLAVVRGTPRDYPTHPTPADCQLVAEVANTTLDFDLGTKSYLYAAAGLPEYWVLDLNNRTLHVFREPVADAEAPRGFRYGRVQALSAAESIAPLAAAQHTIAIAAMLP